MTFLYLSFDQWCLKQLLWRNTYMMKLWIIHFSSKLLEKATSIRNDVLITWNNLHAEQMLECFLSTSEKIFTYDWFYKRSVFIFQTQVRSLLLWIYYTQFTKCSAVCHITLLCNSMTIYQCIQTLKTSVTYFV